MRDPCKSRARSSSKRLIALVVRGRPISTRSSQSAALSALQLASTAHLASTIHDRFSQTLVSHPCGYRSCARGASYMKRRADGMQALSSSSSLLLSADLARFLRELLTRLLSRLYTRSAPSASIPFTCSHSTPSRLRHNCSNQSQFEYAEPKTQVARAR